MPLLDTSVRKGAACIMKGHVFISSTSNPLAEPVEGFGLRGIAAINQPPSTTSVSIKVYHLELNSLH
jgi:hypothetical protein